MSSELETFIHVVEAGSFSAAARELGVLPSTISRQIARLEERLGLRLLHRSTRSVSMTQVGAIYYEGGRRIVEATRRLEDVLQDQGPDLRGTIRVGVPRMMQAEQFSELMAGFFQDNPHTRATVQGITELGAHTARDVDVALWIGDIDDHDWTARQIGSVTYVLVAAPDYLASFGWPRRLSQLEDHHLVVSRQHREWKLTNGEVVRPDPRVLVNEVGHAAELVRGGVGIGMLPADSIRTDVARGKLCRVFPDDGEAVLPISVLYPVDRLFRATARAFVDHSVKYFDAVTLDQTGSEASDG